MILKKKNQKREKDLNHQSLKIFHIIINCLIKATRTNIQQSGVVEL